MKSDPVLAEILLSLHGEMANCEFYILMLYQFNYGKINIKVNISSCLTEKSIFISHYTDNWRSCVF